jgi:ketol-acid reductoisomerase
LFTPEEATARGTVIQYLLSDAGQKDMWPKIKPHLTRGKALYFSHGFSVVYADQTGVVPPADIDVILVAPKGSGTTVRRLFLDGPRKRPRVGTWHRNRIGLPVRDDISEGSLQ